MDMRSSPRRSEYLNRAVVEGKARFEIGPKESRLVVIGGFPPRATAFLSWPFGGGCRTSIL